MENLLVIVVILILITLFLKNVLFAPVSAVDLETEIDPANSSTSEPTLIKEFTPRELSNYNGFDLEKIFIAVRGNVYDVSKARQFYGPSGPYSNFAGHDASRGLALNSFEMENIRTWDQPIDVLSDLSEVELSSLENWEGMFKSKYPCVGTLIGEKTLNEGI